MYKQKKTTMQTKQFKDYDISDFTVKENLPQQEPTERVRASFYRTKKGCYTPPEYIVDRVKLSEVL